jgi:hypothetical protein
LKTVRIRDEYLPAASDRSKHDPRCDVGRDRLRLLLHLFSKEGQEHSEDDIASDARREVIGFLQK